MNGKAKHVSITAAAAAASQIQTKHQHLQSTEIRRNWQPDPTGCKAIGHIGPNQRDVTQGFC